MRAGARGRRRAEQQAARRGAARAADVLAAGRHVVLRCNYCTKPTTTIFIYTPHASAVVLENILFIFGLMNNLNAEQPRAHSVSLTQYVASRWRRAGEKESPLRSVESGGRESAFPQFSAFKQQDKRGALLCVVLS